jgi:dTMP kinase
MLAEALREAGYEVVEAREPGGTRIGERIRSLLIESEEAQSPLVQALLLSASRAELVSEVILPAIREGKIMIVDRFSDSTFAYQVAGFGLEEAIVRELTNIATRYTRPDTVVYVDVPVDVGLERAASRGKRNRLDSESLEFHQRVRDAYLRMADAQPCRWMKVDGTLPPEAVHTAIVERLIGLLPKLAGAA